MEIKAYAKLNLFLDITAKRPDGYHNMRMIMQQVALCDEIEVLPAAGISVECASDTLARRAAALFFSKAGIRGGARIRIEKHIPLEAGLGGGSADAGAVLTALNELYGRPLSREDLRTAACRLGADVPFATIGGTAAAKGIGEKLMPIENNLFAHYLILKPEAGISTKQAFSKFDAQPNYAGGGARFMACVHALKAGDAALFGAHTYNALFAASCALCPEIAQAVALLSAQEGCVCAFMTGSGSACVGMFLQKEQAERAQRRMAVPFAHRMFITCNT